MMTCTALSDYQTRPRHKEEMKYRMPLRTTDYVDVIARATELGIRAPVGIALLPGNFQSAASAAELRYHEAALDVRSSWRSIGLVDGGPSEIGCQSLAPSASASVPLTVFFGAGLRTMPPRLITLAFGMIASVHTLHPGSAGPREIRLNAVVERPSGGYACLEFRGDACELFVLAQAVRETWMDEKTIDRD